MLHAAGKKVVLPDIAAGTGGVRGGAPARVREPDGEAVGPGLRPGGAPPEQEVQSGRTASPKPCKPFRFSGASDLPAFFYFKTVALATP